MKFEYKEPAEFNEMTDAQQKQYATEKRAHEISLIEKEAARQIEEASKGLVSKSDYDALKAKFEAVSEYVTELKENEGSNGSKGLDLDKVVKTNLESIKESFSTKRDHSFNVSKALTLSTAVTGNTDSYRDDTISPLASRRLSLYDLFKKVRIGKNNAGSISYRDWDTATTARAAAMVAEGATFPESTVKWEQKSINIKKIGDSIPWTAEFEYDLARFADELRSFLNTNVKLKEDDQLRDGDGTGVNIFGIKTLAPAYVPVASGIADASRYDLIVKVAEDVTKGLGNKFRVDYALMNLSEINKMRLKKDANNNYIMPPFVDRDGNVIAGVRVIEDNGFLDNEMIIGDSRYGTIYEDEDGYSITTGIVNDQFVQDEETLKARKRMCFLVKDSEKLGHRKVTDITAALTTLAL